MRKKGPTPKKAKSKKGPTPKKAKSKRGPAPKKAKKSKPNPSAPLVRKINRICDEYLAAAEKAPKQQNNVDGPSGVALAETYGEAADSDLVTLRRIVAAAREQGGEQAVMNLLVPVAASMRAQGRPPAEIAEFLRAVLP